MQNLYKHIGTILHEHIQINEQAMVACQDMGYNGFKRMHRCLAKELFCLEIELANDLRDKYRMRFEFDNTPVMYNPMSLKDHLAMWDSKLDQAIKALAELNKEHFQKCGTTNCVIDKVFACFVKKYEKTGRWYKRFEDGQWLVHDCHIIDDNLHSRYKEIEGK